MTEFDVTEFDPIKAKREQLIGWSDVLTTITRREQFCEQSISEAERELNALRKIKGAVRIINDQVIEELRVLEEKAQRG